MDSTGKIDELKESINSINKENKAVDESNFLGFENPNFRKLYATLSVNTMLGSSSDSNKSKSAQNFDSKTQELPLGWEQHEDDSGPYYWHIPSGTIQREKPSSKSAKRDSIIYYEEEDIEKAEVSECTNNLLVNHFNDNCKTFVLNSLGWIQVNDSQLTPDLSSSTLQKCIYELTHKGDTSARSWGKQNTKRLILKIEYGCLKFLDVITNKLLNVQPLTHIKIWEVVGEDFAYAAKDDNTVNEDADISPVTPTSSQIRCHVFHCEVEENGENTSQKIAKCINDEMIRFKSQSQNDYDYDENEDKEDDDDDDDDEDEDEEDDNEDDDEEDEYDDEINERLGKPNSLKLDATFPLISSNFEFPTPIEEPRKTLLAKYLGKTSVNKPTGINVLNEAIDKIIIELNSSNLSKQVKNVLALVHVSPSAVTAESTINGQTIFEFRVRYLSFLGISRKNVKLLGFIIQVDEKGFEAHCFECEPSAGPLCKTVEAACKLRFQKCLDAHKQRCNQSLNNNSLTKASQKLSNQTVSAIKSSLVNAFSKLLR